VSTAMQIIAATNRDAEQIPDTAFGTDVFRFRRIYLELAPQPQDLRVDGPVVPGIVLCPSGCRGFRGVCPPPKRVGPCSRIHRMQMRPQAVTVTRARDSRHS